MSKKKPEKVWMFYGNRWSKFTSPRPRPGRLGRDGWWTCVDCTTETLGWSDDYSTYADEDKAKVALFMKGFLACQAMYAEMFKEAESE